MTAVELYKTNILQNFFTETTWEVEFPFSNFKYGKRLESFIFCGIKAQIFEGKKDSFCTISYSLWISGI